MDDMKLLRLDMLVAAQCGFSREYAREAVTKGLVSLQGKTLAKPGLKLPADTVVEVTAGQMKYVGRGGYKLEKAVAIFEISVHNNTCMDIGASTGGFTDCLLQAGAAKVYAIDTGKAQLADSLQGNPKVVSMEGTNIRELLPDAIGAQMDCITIDVSFISLIKVLPHAASFLASDGAIIALVKPQFEAGRAHINRSGVVADPKVHLHVLRELYKALPACGLYAHGCIASPLRGQNGNAEYLLCLRAYDGLSEAAFLQAAKDAVAESRTAKER